MSNFNNVKIKKKPNIYFEGKVYSYSLLFDDGSRKTLGVMQAGEYKFNTEEKEIIDFSDIKAITFLYFIFLKYDFVTFKDAINNKLPKKLINNFYENKFLKLYIKNNLSCLLIV